MVGEEAEDSGLDRLTGRWWRILLPLVAVLEGRMETNASRNLVIRVVLFEEDHFIFLHG